jgi:hypothetical protein
MPSRGDRSAHRLAALGFLGVLVVLAGLPAYLWIDPGWRPVAVRLACGVIVIAGCLRAWRAVRRAIGEQAASPLDARPVPPPPPVLDERFLRARDDLVFSRRSRRYFDAILWPRLLALAGGDLVRPRPRRWIGRRGPSSGALARLVGDVERRP